MVSLTSNDWRRLEKEGRVLGARDLAVVNSDPGFGRVYVVSSIYDDRWFKIGRTRGDPKARLDALMAGHLRDDALRIEIVFVSRAYKDLETFLHHQFGKRPGFREWVKAGSVDDVCSAVERFERVEDARVYVEKPIGLGLG